MKRKAMPILFLTIAMLVSGCSGQGEKSMAVDFNQIFSDRDFEVGYDESESILIQLKEDSATCSSDKVQISGSIVTITDEGTYILTGELNDGMIKVNAEKTDKIHLILDGITIHSETYVTGRAWDSLKGFSYSYKRNLQY